MQSRTGLPVSVQSPCALRTLFRCQPLWCVHLFVWRQRLYCCFCKRGGFFPFKPTDQHELYASVVCRHYGSLMVLTYHRIYFKVAEATLFVYYLRPVLNTDAVLDYASGPVCGSSFRILATLTPTSLQQPIIVYITAASSAASWFCRIDV